jgi:hypothetical protein
VQLPIHTHVLQVWPRGSRSAGWRLIDDQLDGNPIPHYDALFYDNWARTVGWGGGQQCTFECYTYKVLGDTIRWVPFQVGDDYWLNYSYVACESLPGSADDGNERSDVALRVLGSPAKRGGGLSLRVTMSQAGRLWLAVFSLDGRLVRQLARGTPVEAKVSELQWDLKDQGGRPVAAGMYFVRMKAAVGGNRRVTRDTRVIVVR